MMKTQRFERCVRGKFTSSCARFLLEELEVDERTPLDMRVLTLPAGEAPAATCLNNTKNEKVRTIRRQQVCPTGKRAVSRLIMTGAVSLSALQQHQGQISARRGNS